MLVKLCDDPKAVEIVPLNPILGIPDGVALVGRNQGAENPQLCILMSPRSVKWAHITRCPEEDGSERLQYNPTRGQKLKPGITVGKIIVLISTKESDEEPEIPWQVVQNKDTWELNKGRES